MKKSNLTIKQKRFIQEFVKTNNATQAALIAYNCKNRNVAAATGSRLLRNVNVKKEIKRFLQEQGYNPHESIERLRKTAEMGTGIKATAKDQIRADQILLKANGVFNKDNQPTTYTTEYNIVANLMNLSYEELLKRSENTNKNHRQIIDGEKI